MRAASVLAMVMFAFGVSVCNVAAADRSQVVVGSFTQLYGDGSGESQRPPLLVGDFTRDGQVGRQDVELKLTGTDLEVFVLANVDDDDGSGRRDCDDEIINGLEDRKDLAEIDLLGDPTVTYQLRLSANANHFRFFDAATERVVPFSNRVASVRGNTRLLVEAKGFARRGFDGRLLVELLLDGQVVCRLRLRVAPWIMLPNSNRTEAVYIATGHANYPNQATINGLRSLLSPTGIPLGIHAPWGAQAPNGQGNFHEMWLQDAMEIGYTSLPGREPMHVVLRGLRRTERFPHTLLGPDYGYIEVGSFRPLSGGDDWADWMGNLEVTAPVPNHPLGRIYYGVNRRTGVGLHPEVVDFLNAQGVQKPFSVNTSWLTIKHVDEIFNFVPARDGSARMIIVSPEKASQVVGAAGYDAYNRGIQREVDQTIREVKAATGIRDEHIIRLPLFFRSGHTLWSNPVNSIHVNGTVVFGDTDLPQSVRTYLQRSMSAIGLQSAFIHDRPYQRNYGNIHCATNTKKVPHSTPWYRILSP